MSFTKKLGFGGLALASLAALPSAAQAQQPLAVVVNPLQTAIYTPLAIGGAIVQAPFQVLAAPFTPPARNSYNGAPALAAAVSVDPTDFYGTVAYPVLQQTGPHYDNPANAVGRPYVIRRGALVPGYVNTAPLRDVSVAGLAPGARYDFFISPEGRTVILDPATRQVVRVLR